MTRAGWMIFQTEFLLWLRSKVELFWSLCWPVGWVLLMDLFTSGEGSEALPFYYPSSLVLILVATMTSSATRLSVEKEHKNLKRFRILPFSKHAYLVIQFLFSVTTSLFAAVVLTLVTALLGMDFKFSHILFLLPPFVLGGVFFALLGFFSAGITDSMKTNSILATILVYLMIFFSNVYIPIEMVNYSIYRWTYILPVSPLVAIFRGVLIEGSTLAPYGLEFGVIFLWTLGVFVLTLLAFRWD